MKFLGSTALLGVSAFALGAAAQWAWGPQIERHARTAFNDICRASGLSLAAAKPPEPETATELPPRNRSARVSELEVFGALPAGKFSPRAPSSLHADRFSGYSVGSLALRPYLPAPDTSEPPPDLAAAETALKRMAAATGLPALPAFDAPAGTAAAAAAPRQPAPDKLRAAETEINRLATATQLPAAIHWPAALVKAFRQATARPAARTPAPPRTIASATPPVKAALTSTGANPYNALRAISSAVAKPAEPHFPANLKVASYAPAGADPSARPALAVPGPLAPEHNRILEPSERFDLTGVREAIEAYEKNNLDLGDSIARKLKGKVARTAVEWAALRKNARKAGYRRIMAFLDANPDWPYAKWLRARAETSLYFDRAYRRHAKDYLARFKPVSVSGKLAIARHLVASGKKAEARKIVAEIWREERLGKWLEAHILKNYDELLGDADHKYRSDAMFYRGSARQSLAAAGKAGKDYYKFAAARFTVRRGVAPDKAHKGFRSSLLKDPSWVYASAYRLRKKREFAAAAKLLISVPDAKMTGAAAQKWWYERRYVARELLDNGDPKTAYKVAATHQTTEGEEFISAEFHAGWIALRFLDRPADARKHFARALKEATTPISRARAAYWHGRALEAAQKPDDAKKYYRRAAGHPSTYYGQLAHTRLGLKELPVRRAKKMAGGADRHLSIRVIQLLIDADEKDFAFPLVVGIGRTMKDEAQIAALARILRRANDARAMLVLGKFASYRGIELDDIAFPAFGIPDYVPLAQSAPKPLVYAIARQESAFRPKVVSHAGAKGLMQMLTSTARRTARNKGVAFDARRLLSDPAFNAQLGAAHLGELREDHPGSMIMVFAAYNAGGHRVKQWIEKYGDPRKPGVDPIDWVERIPFSETRNYVQRVAENLGVYRAIFRRKDIPHVPENDLRAYAARM